MKLRLILIPCFNIIDIIATFYVLSHGGVELNPMAVLMLQWPIMATLVKNASAILFSMCCWQAREHIISKIFSWIAFIWYGALVLYYICTLCF